MVVEEIVGYQVEGPYSFGSGDTTSSIPTFTLYIILLFYKRALQVC